MSENGYEDEEFPVREEEEYQEAEGDVCVENYYEEQEEEQEEVVEREEEFRAEEFKDGDDVVNVTEEGVDEEQVVIHGAEDDLVFTQDTVEPVENDEISQDDEKEHVEEKEEVESKEEVVECTLTEEEIQAQYAILDDYQRQADEEQYTLRKLRSIIGHQTDDIERTRKKIASYTKEAQDRKAMEAMEVLKQMKSDRERAVEERRISTDLLADIRAKRASKVADLRSSVGLIVDPSASYLIEDKELKKLFSEIRTCLKHNSFAVLKFTIPELDDVIWNVANVCDAIDDFLTQKNVRPRDINKLNTKEHRVSVLYDKLVKWRTYKVKDPDIRPTDYESFMYDPDDMFSESEDDKDRSKKSRDRERPKREMRAVRGGDISPRNPASSARDSSPRNSTTRDTSPRTKKAPSSDRKPVAKSAHSPIRPPTPTEKTPPPPPRESRPVPARRAVRGGSPDEVTDEQPKERPLRAERGGDLGPRRDQPIRKRRADPIESDNFKQRRHTPPRRPRSPPPRRERPYTQIQDKRPATHHSAGQRREHSGGRPRTTLLSTPPKTSHSNYSGGRSPSPPNYRSSRGRAIPENFQISVRNESYKPRYSQAAGGRSSNNRFGSRSDDRQPTIRDNRTRASSTGYRGRGRGQRRATDERAGGSYRR